MEKDKKIKIYLGLIYLTIIVIFLLFLFSKYSLNEIASYNFLKLNSHYFLTLKEGNYILISILFILFGIFWTVLAGFAMPIMLISGFIFGKWIGTLFSLLGLSIGATIFYIIIKYFFLDLIKEKFSKKFSWLENKFKKNELIYLLLYRCVGGLPFQIQNILPALFNVKIKNYFLSFLGLVPQIFIWCSLGSGLEKVIEENISTPSIIEIFSTPDIYKPIIGFVILLIIVMFIKNRYFKN